MISKRKNAKNRVFSTMDVMAESMRDMRRSVYERELLPRYASLKMWEITEEDLRSLCDRIVERGAPATAVHAREIVLMVFRFASERGNKDPNPAELVRPHTIAVFQPRDRALSPADIGSVYEYLEHVATSPVIRLAVKLLLLTMLRKSELIMGEWSEINFTDAVWTIPARRMKRRNPHNPAGGRTAGGLQGAQAGGGAGETGFEARSPKRLANRRHQISAAPEPILTRAPNENGAASTIGCYIRRPAWAQRGYSAENEQRARSGPAPMRKNVRYRCLTRNPRRAVPLGSTRNHGNLRRIYLVDGLSLAALTGRWRRPSYL